jgi:hypothetical protein
MIIMLSGASVPPVETYGDIEIVGPRCPGFFPKADALSVGIRVR